jgi:hypothetical protein
MLEKEPKSDMLKIVRHRGHDDSHRVTMGTDLVPKKGKNLLNF